MFKTNDKKILSYRIYIYNLGGIFILRTLKICYMPVFCLFTLGRHGNFTAGVTLEQPDLLCTALRAVEYYHVCRIRDVILEMCITVPIIVWETILL